MPDYTSVIPMPSSTAAAQRRRRLRRGVERWELDRQHCSEPTVRIATLTLTIHENDFEAARRRALVFWRRVRQRWIGTRYFCWLELQARGAVHYHCVWLNPPHQKRVNLLKWVDKAWGIGRTQVRFADGSAGLDAQLAYAEKYVRKMGRKAYQQRYDDVPRWLRTFMNQRLEAPVAAVDASTTGDEYAYVPPRVVAGTLLPAGLVRIGHREHVWTDQGQCPVAKYRTPRRWHPPWHLGPELHA